MANRTQTIVINSILGGESTSENFSSDGQFLHSFGIDPDLPSGEGSYLGGGTINTGKPSGFLRPVYVSPSEATMPGASMWIVPNPKLETAYLYGADGSVYTTTYANDITGLGDLNDGGTASGNGAAYYDNYIYFARDTTVARYGPLNGTPAFTDDYWVTTLSKAALSNTEYPEVIQVQTSAVQAPYPNHVMKRHSDGALYFADTVGNQGYIHKIKTTKTTVEGDTNDGSTEQVLDLPFGYWPTSIESYGESLVIAVYEGRVSGTDPQILGSRAKIIFWDCVSDSYNQIIDFEFPDLFISRIINVNGYLYTISGTPNGSPGGVRICRYLGGNSFEQIALINNNYLPPHDAVDHNLYRLYIAGNEDTGDFYPCVRAVGSQIGAPVGLFTVMGTGTTSTTGISSLKIVENGEYLNQRLPMIASTQDTGSALLGQKNSWLNSTKNSGDTQFFISQVYPIGQRFKITKIRIPLASSLVNTLGLSKQIDIIVYVDGLQRSMNIQSISNTTFPADSATSTLPLVAVIEPENCTGQYNFALRLNWTSAELITIALPITIEYEIIPD